MEFRCPECMGPLVSSDGQNARCTVHGGEYQILFSRSTLPMPAREAGAAVPAPAENAVCLQHPNVAVAYACRDCGAGLCAVCAFPQPDGTQLCPNCEVRRAETGQSGAVPTGFDLIPDGVRCVQHPQLPATGKCQSCGAFMCQTCVFDFPGGIRLCPACATSTDIKLSPRRRRLIIASFALAVWCTFWMAALFGGAFASMAQDKGGEALLGIVMSLGLLIPSIIGVSLGFSAVERRMPATVAMWIAISWNGLILGGYVLMIIVGVLRGG